MLKLRLACLVRRRRSRSLSCQSRSVVSFVRRRPSANTEVNDLWKGARACGRASERACKRVNGRRVGRSGLADAYRISQPCRARPPPSRARALFSPQPPPLSLSSQSCKVERAALSDPGRPSQTSWARPALPARSANRQQTARAVRRDGGGRR